MVRKLLKVIPWIAMVVIWVMLLGGYVESHPSFSHYLVDIGLVIFGLSFWLGYPERMRGRTNGT